MTAGLYEWKFIQFYKKFTITFHIRMCYKQEISVRRRTFDMAVRYCGAEALTLNNIYLTSQDYANDFQRACPRLLFLSQLQHHWNMYFLTSKPKANVFISSIQCSIFISSEGNKLQQILLLLFKARFNKYLCLGLKLNTMNLVKTVS